LACTQLEATNKSPRYSRLFHSQFKKMLMSCPPDFIFHAEQSDG
jgi:hypothetical protein